MSDFTIGAPQSRAVSPNVRNLEALSLQLRVDQERRRSSIVHDEDVIGTEHVLKGRTQLQGSGEATIDLRFPVTFIEPPTFTFGGELALGSQALEAGQFPIISCCVATWLTPIGTEGFDEGPYMPDATADNNYSIRVWYRGARIACVATGPSTQNMYIHWMFTGVAITNPVGASLGDVPLAGSATSGTIEGTAVP